MPEAAKFSHLCRPTLSMKKLLFLLFLLPAFAWAQKTHTVAPKETLYSIGRLYNVHPRELAAYNNLTIETGLTIGQVIKIPAKTTMAPLPPATDKPVATDKPANDKPVTEKPVVEKKPAVKTASAPQQTATLVPVYHTVQKKENLYQISRLYNKVPIDNLKKWNHLSSDALAEGTKLIVGYTATGNEGNIPAQKPIEEKPANPAPEKKTEPVAEEKKDPVTEKKTEPVVTKTEPVKAAKEPEQPKARPVEEKAVNFMGGNFKAVYEAQAKNKQQGQDEGTAGVFKSTSGWNDGKYYCLHNTAQPGTIIKVTNKANGKSIYAKVLDIIPDLKQNAGLVIRISNAAGQELGVGENNFDCILNYSK